MTEKKIYVVCPAKIATGGPELLHQLCHKLNKFGYKAYMYYYYEGEEKTNPVAEPYKVYNNNYVFEVEDSTENIIVAPEVNVNILKKFKKAQKAVWWLSVDNYFTPRMRKKYKLMHLFGLLEFNYKKDDVLHFAQSYYAMDFLSKQNINKDNVFYLSDYLSHTFIENSKKDTGKEKIDYVLYNPKKGYEFTKKLIETSEGIEWKPLENLTPAKMAELLKQSKVYIDFGNHPGKDRIPREAAISGCCIITGKKGSAKYNEDVSIPEAYKIEDKDENIDVILERIKYLINNYSQETKKFDKYREKILNEEKRFEEDIKQIFSTIIR